MEEKEILERLHALEVAQATQAASAAGAQATQAATTAGAQATQAATQAGTWSTMVSGSVSLIVGILLGATITKAKA